MKEGWIYKKLGEVCEVTDYVANGSFATLRQNVKYYNEPNYAILVRLADFSSNFDISKFVYVDKHSYEFLSKSKLFGGEIIMSNVGSIGKCFICPKLADKMTIGPNSLLIRTPYNDFYLYYFKSEAFQKDLVSITNTATLSKFNKTQFRTLSFPVPPLSEQQRIVAQLDEAFAEIDMIKAEAEKQLSDAKALFQKALSQAMTPKEGWEKKTLGEMAEVIHGKNQKEVQSSDGRYPIYGSGGNIMGYASDYLCEAGTTILGRKGSINNPIYINERFWNVDTAFGIAPKNGNISKFIYYFVRSIDWLEKNTGTTLPSLTQQVVKRVTMPAPPLSEQQRIVEELDELSENVKEIEALNNKLTAECDAMKQALLRQVFE